MRSARRGTSIGEALRKAVRSFGELDAGLHRSGAGQRRRGPRGPAARGRGRCSRGLGLRLHTVGVGDPERSMPIPIADDAAGHAYLVHDGQEVQTRMRSGLLTGMADAAGGVNLALEDGTDRLGRLYAEHIAGQPRRELATAGDQELGAALPVLPAARGGPAAGRGGAPPLAARRRRREGGGRKRADPGAGHAGGSGPGCSRSCRSSGADQAAQDGARRQPALQAGQYEAALRRLRAAAGALPELAPGGDDRVQPGQRAVQEPRSRSRRSTAISPR